MPHLDNTQPASQFIDIVALAEQLQVPVPLSRYTVFLDRPSFAFALRTLVTAPDFQGLCFDLASRTRCRG